MGDDSIIPNQQVEALAEEAKKNEKPTLSLWAPAYISNEIDRLKELQKIIELSYCRVTDKELFCTLIRETVDRTDLYPEELAKELEVSHSTVSRWMNRSASPHPAKKRFFLKKLKSLCKKEIKKFPSIA